MCFDDLDMQPLHRINAKANVAFGMDSTMKERPDVSVLVADFIAHWTNLESMFPLSLALILDADQKATLAMYGSLENRAAQSRMLLAGAKAKLDNLHYGVLEAILAIYIRPLMKERDRFAHWVWGYSPDILDGLLLMEPNHRAALHAAAINPPSPIAWDFSKIFVLRKSDIERSLERLREAHDIYARFVSTNWKINPPELRAQWTQRLSNEPPIREFLDRQNRAHKNSPTTATQSPQPNDLDQS
jgi:hypothetical protein